MEYVHFKCVQFCCLTWATSCVMDWYTWGRLFTSHVVISTWALHLSCWITISGTNCLADLALVYGTGTSVSTELIYDTAISDVLAWSGVLVGAGDWAECGTTIRAITFGHWDACSRHWAALKKSTIEWRSPEWPAHCLRLCYHLIIFRGAFHLPSLITRCRAVFVPASISPVIKCRRDTRIW